MDPHIPFQLHCSQDICLPTAVVGVIVDNIVSIAMVVHVRVAAIAALEVVVAPSADKYVVTTLYVYTFYHIVR